MKKIVIYGSYGYTGNLIAELASKSDLTVVLSGRDDQKLTEQSARLGLSYRKASLDSKDEMDYLLSSADAVIHCAGPFVRTWQQMAEACIRNQCHYLDITGEIVVFESLKKMGSQFKEAGIMAMAGTGFDVVPTDCLASYLSSRLPDADKLELAFMGLGGGVSRGTARTMVENIGEGGLIRKNGLLKKVPAAFRTKKIDFGKKESSAVTIPWGDISTAFTSTGIPDIKVYMSAPSKMIRSMKFSNYIRFLLKIGFVKKMLLKKIDQRPPGPDNHQREQGRSYIWGRVENESGHHLEGVIETCEGYRLTAEMAWNIVNKVVQGNFESGYQTPSTVYGSELIFEHPDTKWVREPK
tara:strand:+ start:13761 stop:14819 length:1059 start_codon:yes stop_codon:yes gene_type:complete